MRTQIANTIRFIRLDTAARTLGAQSKRQFVADFRTLTNRERREIAELLSEKEGRQ
jgi:hypothetical protein